MRVFRRRGKWCPESYDLNYIAPVLIFMCSSSVIPFCQGNNFMDSVAFSPQTFNIENFSDCESGLTHHFDLLNHVKCDSNNKTLDLSALSKYQVLVDGDSECDEIAASSRECLVTRLRVTSPHLLDNSIGENCGNLTVIEMTGRGWNCSWSGWKWLKEWHEQPGHQNIQSLTYCNYTTDHCYKECTTFNTGLHYQIACMTGIEACDPCICSFLYRSDVTPPAFLATVDCSSKQLLNHMVPDNLPLTADILSFENNFLSNVSALMQQAASMPYLNVINLSNNNLTTVPAILPSHASISVIYLTNNRISQLMGPAFNTYLNRSAELQLHIKGNPLKCGCEFYQIAIDLKRRGKGQSVLNFFSDFFHINCQPIGSLPKLYLDESCPDYIHDSPQSSLFRPIDALLLLLALLNLLFISLAVDLQMAIYELKKGYSQPRTPRIHIFYLFCKLNCNRPCKARNCSSALSSNRAKHITPCDDQVHTKLDPCSTL